MSRVSGVKFEDFDPNDTTRLYTLWAVYNGRQFKTYTSRGPALNGFGSYGQAKLYEYVGGSGWVARAVLDSTNQPDVCDVCGHPRVKDTYMTTYGTLSYDYNSRWQWKRTQGKITSPPVLLHCCAVCRDAVRHA